MISTTAQRLAQCRQAHTPKRKGVMVRTYDSNGTLVSETEVAVHVKPHIPPMVDETYGPYESEDWALTLAGILFLIAIAGIALGAWLFSR